MCGIAGFWTSHLTADSASDTLRRMTDALVHRGPDDAGAWFDDRCGVALGHRRLSIVDLSPLGHQPMQSASERYVVVYNGEIYNFRALRSSLESRGTRFRGHSDTEVLLALIDRDGLSAAVRQCTGMFAIALWDRQARALHLVRDRFGEKPLYVARVDGGIAFASELTPLRQLPGFDSTFDRDALAQYMRHGYIPAPRSVYTSVTKVMPGTIVSYHEARLDPAVEVYWSARDVAAAGARNQLPGDDETLVETCDAIMRKAVGDQMLADVPLGAFLSGGIDSSLVVALMQAQSARPVRTFTIGFEEKAFDESPHAEAVAKHLGTDHTTMFVTAKDALAIIPRLPEIYDEPFADASQVPTSLVAALARQHVTVALSGDGGDELFGGYSRYDRTMRLWQKLDRVPSAMRRVAASAVAGISASRWDAALTPVGLTARGITGDRLHKLAELVEAPTASRFYHDFVSSWRRPLEVVRGAADPAGAFGDVLPSHPGGLLAELMLRDQLTYLPDDILVKVDRAAMAASLESRAPLLNHEIAEFAWRLPRRAWWRDGQGKWILRRLLDRYVPRPLVDRPKMGFGIPYAEWLRGPLRNWADDLLAPAALEQDGLFHAAPIIARWREHRGGERNWAPSLWFVLMFQAWRAKHR